MNIKNNEMVQAIDGPVKIVGMNHGLCLHLFLLRDGWKKEQFTDVTFYCHTPLESDNLKKNKLSANRSVLAASSPFFASLLPDSELELNVCITIDIGFEDMFCILEYIYSGKLLCPIKSKKRILKILEDFKIHVPAFPPENQEQVVEPKDTELNITVSDGYSVNQLGLDPPFCSNGDLSIAENLNPSNQHLPDSETNSTANSNIERKVAASNTVIESVNDRPTKLLRSPNRFEVIKKNATSTSVTRNSEVNITDIASSSLSKDPVTSFRDLHNYGIYSSRTCTPVDIGQPRKSRATKPSSAKIRKQSLKKSLKLAKQSIVKKRNHSINPLQLAKPPSSYINILPKTDASVTSVHIQDRSYNMGQSIAGTSQKVLSLPLNSAATDNVQMVSLKENYNSSNQPPTTAVIDELTLQSTPDKAAVTLQVPSSFYNKDGTSTDLEPSQIKRSLIQRYTYSGSLPAYHSETWCYGIYTPRPPDVRGFTEERTNRVPLPSTNLQYPIPHKTTFPQPTRFYSRRNKNQAVQAPPANSNIAGLIIKVADIQFIQSLQGNCQFVLNAKPSGQPAVVIQDQGVLMNSLVNTTETTLRKKSASDEETEEDRVDLMRAKYFQEFERRRKRVLRKKLARLTRQLNTEKEIARSILKKVKDFESGKSQNLAAHLPKIVKKSRPKKQCNQCGKMVAASVLRKHLALHSGLKPHLCELCGRTFALRSYLNAHNRMHHFQEEERPKPFKCKSCPYSTYAKKNLEVHERIHTDERPFDCQYCDKKFREKGTLVRHLRTHTGEKPYVCNVCGNSYAARDSYLGHYKRKHEKIDPNNPIPSRFFNRRREDKRCEYCGQEFVRALAYQKHLATHTGAPLAVRCSEPDCDFTYSTMNQFRDHMATSHPDQIYTCEICSKVFLSKQSHHFHQARHENAPIYQCSYCPVTTKTKTGLAVHETTHTRENPYECTYCEMRFHSPYLLNLHLRKEHLPKQPRKRIRTKKTVEIVETEEIEPMNY